MRKNLLILFVFCCSYVHAQFVTIPDANFRNVLKTKVPGCFNVSNQLDTTCSAVVQLQELDVTNKSIQSLVGISYFDNLKSLICDNNPLTTLPRLPAGLISLFCREDQLTSLPPLPSTLSWLIIDGNKLTSLPQLPARLKNLDFAYNQIAIVPALPEGLTDLFCSQNKFTTLPVLPSTLVSLICENNQIQCLPTLPEGLFLLGISQTQVTCLPNKPANIRSTLPICAQGSTCSVPLGVADGPLAEQSQTSVLFPNPAKGTLHVRISEAAELVLFDQQQQEILRQTLQQGQTTDISMLRPGMYYYSLADKTGKLIVE